MLKCAVVCFALLARVVSGGFDPGTPTGVKETVKRNSAPLSDRRLKREIRRYYRNVPNLALWDDIEARPVKVLCATPEFCFYCPLAGAMGKPFFISSKITRPTNDHINEVGLKCLKSLHDSNYGHLLTVLDYVALAVLQSGDLDGGGRGQLALRRAQNKLLVVQKLVCEQEASQPRPDSTSSLCVDCALVESKKCMLHIEKLCATGRPLRRRRRWRSPGLSDRVNFLWLKLGDETQEVCSAYSNPYVPLGQKQHAYARIAAVIASRCEEERESMQCPVYHEDHRHAVPADGYAQNTSDGEEHEDDGHKGHQIYYDSSTQRHTSYHVPTDHPDARLQFSRQHHENGPVSSSYQHFGPQNPTPSFNHQVIDYGSDQYNSHPIQNYDGAQEEGYQNYSADKRRRSASALPLQSGYKSSVDGEERSGIGQPRIKSFFGPGFHASSNDNRANGLHDRPHGRSVEGPRFAEERGGGGERFSEAVAGSEPRTAIFNDDHTTGAHNWLHGQSVEGLRFVEDDLGPDYRASLVDDRASLDDRPHGRSFQYPGHGGEVQSANEQRFAESSHVPDGPSTDGRVSGFIPNGYRRYETDPFLAFGGNDVDR